MRRTLPHLLALVLGVAAALLVACGEGNAGRIPAADADDLNGQLEDVRARVEQGSCDRLAAELRRVDDGIDQLPSSVDSQLLSALRDGAEKLRDKALDECNENQQPETTTTPTQTQTQPPPTQPQTQTAPPETQTSPTQTEPPPPPDTPEPPPEPEPEPEPPVVPEPPPAPEPGGGTPPEVP